MPKIALHNQINGRVVHDVNLGPISVKNQGMLMARKKGFMVLPHLACRQLMPQLGQLVSSRKVCKEISVRFFCLLLILFFTFVMLATNFWYFYSGNHKEVSRN